MRKTPWITIQVLITTRVALRKIAKLTGMQMGRALDTIVARELERVKKNAQ